MARGTNKSAVHGKKMSYTKFGYIFIAPFCLVYLIFSLYPMLTTFWYSGTNMTSTTADFWGFKNKEVYYDQYLDLTKYYSEDSAFESSVGITKQQYNLIRSYFSVQNEANMDKPLRAEGLQAILDNGSNDTISADTISQVQQALDNQDFTCLTSEAITELTTWSGSFVDLQFLLEGEVEGINSDLDAIVNSTSSSEESETSTEETAITAESIVTSDDFSAFIKTLNDGGEYDEGTTALIAYLTDLSGKDSLAEYFQAAVDGEVSIEDPTFFYICSNLSKPNAVIDVDGEETDVTGIDVPFLSDLESYLTENVWPTTISSLNSYADLVGYADGTIDLHTNEEQLYSDLETLQNAGIINVVSYEVSGGTLVASEDNEQNVLAALREFIDTDYQANEVGVAAASAIANIKQYNSNAGTAVQTMQGIMKNLGITDVNVNDYISFDGELNIDKYLSFKSLVGLTDVLNIDTYERLDAEKKTAEVEEAKASLAENQALLPDVQAAYDAAVASGDEEQIEETFNDLRTVENAIESANQSIKDPKGLLAHVNAKSEYLFVGLQNFSQIFTNKTRLNMVAGAFSTTAIMWIIGFVPQILLALLLSSWFTDNRLKLKCLNLMKSLMYLPNVITAVTIAVFFRRIFSYSNGGAQSVSQMILKGLGDSDGYNFFESPWATRCIVSFINFWMWYGNTMIVLIAGISSISESLYESAQIDGANSFQTYTKITLPLLRPIMLYTLVSSLIGGLQMFDIPQNLNMNPALTNFNGTMIRSTRTILMYVNNQAFGMQDIKQVGIASAVSILLFIVTTALSILIFYVMRDKDASKAKKLAKKGGIVK